MKSYILHNVKSRPIFLLIIPLALSAFTHLWNPIGFPDLFSDEGVYMRRSLHVLEGLGPQETGITRSKFSMATASNYQKKF
jgi:hypothetical protein